MCGALRVGGLRAILKRKLRVVFSNVDVLKTYEMKELELIIEEERPDIVALSEVKPKNYDRIRTLAEYKIEGYNMEEINTCVKDSTRGMIVHIHNSVTYTRKTLASGFLNKIYRKKPL